MIKTTAQDTKEVSTKAKKVETPIEAPVEDVIDIDLTPIKRKKFRLNGDNRLIIELNISDMGIVSRISEATPRLNKLQEKAIAIGQNAAKEDDTDKALKSFAKDLAEINQEMCELIDFIFDGDVSSKCTDGGTMYDLLEGQFRYDYVIEKFMNMYADNIKLEYKKLRDKINKYAKKK